MFIFYKRTNCAM